MSEQRKKDAFKTKLAGETDWRELAMWLMYEEMQAEEREKAFCEDSRYWMLVEKERKEKMNLTDEQYSDLLDEYVEWVEQNELL